MCTFRKLMRKLYVIPINLYIKILWSCKSFSKACSTKERFLANFLLLMFMNVWKKQDRCYNVSSLFLLLFSGCVFILLSRESDWSAVTSSLRSYRPSIHHTKMWESRHVPFPRVQHVNLPACSPHCSFRIEASSRKAVNTNFQVIGLIRLGIKPAPTALRADALATRPS